MSEVNEWNSTLFGCFDDCGICCYGCCCESCLFGSNAKRLDGSNWCVNCCIFFMLGRFHQSWLPHYFKREKLRKIYNLREDGDCGDVGATLCCGPCALCQEAREMKAKGHYREVSTARSAVYKPIQQVSTQPMHSRQYPQDTFQTDAF